MIEIAIGILSAVPTEQNKPRGSGLCRCLQNTHLSTCRSIKLLNVSYSMKPWTLAGGEANGAKELGAEGLSETRHLDPNPINPERLPDLLGVSKGTVQRCAPGPRRAYAIAEWMQPKLGVSVLTSVTNKLTARHATNGVVLWHKGSSTRRQGWQLSSHSIMTRGH
jgi:hypothetical protein